MKQINTIKAPQAIGPYSQAIVSNSMVYCSGQIALDPATGNLVGDDVQTQTKQVLHNLSAVVEAAGSSMDKVVKTTCYLTNLSEFQIFNKEYEAFFGQSKPARATVEVSKLPKGAKVEIEIIAEL